MATHLKTILLNIMRLIHQTKLQFLLIFTIISTLTGYSQSKNLIKEGFFNGYTIKKSQPFKLNTKEDFKYFSLVSTGIVKGSVMDANISQNINNKNISIKIDNSYSKIITQQFGGNISTFVTKDRVTEVFKLSKKRKLDSYIAAFQRNDERDISFLRLMENSEGGALYIMKYDIDFEYVKGNRVMMIQMNVYSNFALNDLTKESLLDDFIYSVILAR